MAFTIGNMASLPVALAKLMGTFYANSWCSSSSCWNYRPRARLQHLEVHQIHQELLIALGTSSSESVLPRMMAKLENLGVKKSTVGLVVPTGYSFNLDGTAIYLTMAAVFIAQATNTPLDLTNQLTLLECCF